MVADPTLIPDSPVKYPVAPPRCQSNGFTASPSQSLHRKQGRKACVARRSVPAHTTAPLQPLSPAAPHTPMEALMQSEILIDQKWAVDFVCKQHESLSCLDTIWQDYPPAPSTINPLVKQIADLTIRLSQAESALAEADAKLQMSTTSQRLYHTQTENDCTRVRTAEASVQTDPELPAHNLQLPQSKEKTDTLTGSQPSTLARKATAAVQQKKTGGQGPLGFLFHLFSNNPQAQLMSAAMLQSGEIRLQGFAGY